MRLADSLLAEPLAAGSIINSTGVNAILITVFGFVVLALAIRAGMHALRSNFSAVILMIGILAVAAMFYNLASSNQIGTLGGDLVHQLLNI